MENEVFERGTWTSKLGFILAAAGSAVGLGNIWRFPYVVGENGGALFLIIYLIAIFFIGYPVMVSEMAIGRKSNKNPVGAFKALAPDTPWWLAGALGVLTGFVILSYYSVIGGWSIAYTLEALGGFPEGADFASVFGEHISNPGTVILWHGVFMAICVSIIGAGVVKGIQRAVKVLMPILFVILVFLVIRSVTLDGAGAGLEFYLAPNLGDIRLQSFTDAIAQAFFTLSLGMGAMITYGSYLSDDDNICDSAGFVLGLDTLIAILAGFAIFPAVFALGATADAGPGLTFMVLPEVFSEMPMGGFFGAVFFLLLTIAAVTSAISLLEVVVSWMVDEKGWPRKKAAAVLGTLIFFVGIPPILGYSVWSGFEFLGMDVLDTYDWFANDIFLPLGGLLTAVFAGHVWKAKNTAEEANKPKGNISVGSIFGIMIKYIVPIAIGVVMVLNIADKF